MSKNAVPDAWDDDWETLADKPEPTITQPEPAPKLSKSQRRAQHLEQQKQLWDSADNPDRFHWLETQGVVPLKQDFKPQVKLLSRKPNAPVIATRSTATGVAGLSLEDDEDSEEEARRKRASDLEELQRQAKLQREEKQRKYAEARQRIMGSPSTTNPTSPAPNASRDSSHGRENMRSRGKMNGSRGSQPSSSADQSPAPTQTGEKQLFDPDDMGRRMPKRETSTTVKEDHPVRQPRNPDRSGRGGFGFAARGGTVAS